MPELRPCPELETAFPPCHRRASAARPQVRIGAIMSELETAFPEEDDDDDEDGGGCGKGAKEGQDGGEGGKSKKGGRRSVASTSKALAPAGANRRKSASAVADSPALGAARASAARKTKGASSSGAA